MMPLWATAIVKDVCKEQGRIPLPTINWYGYRDIDPFLISKLYGGDVMTHVAWKHEVDYGFEGCSFGQCQNEKPYEIDIFAGFCRKDQRLVLLHEMSHYVLSRHRMGHIAHSAAFWDLTFRLFLRHGVPIMDGIERESRTKHKRSIKAWAKRQGIAA